MGLVLLLITLPTLLWWSWADEKIHVWRQASGRLRWGRRLLYIACLYTLLLLVPLLLLAIGGGWRLFDQLPRPVLMWNLAWHLSLMVSSRPTALPHCYRFVR